MASCPVIRERIMTGLKLTDGPIGGSITKIKREIGCGDVSNGKFRLALNSLRYHYGAVTWCRESEDVVPKDLRDVSLTVS